MIDPAKILQIMVDKPTAVFIVLSAAFGYAYYVQNDQMLALEREVGGLRAEVLKMHEIIQLNHTIAKMSCNVPVD